MITYCPDNPSHLRPEVHQSCGMDFSAANTVLLGVGIGMLSLIAPGPVNLALLQFGARRGRTHAVRGALGVMGGDSLLGVTAVLILGAGAALPAQAFQTAQVIAALLLLVIGSALFTRPAAAAASVDRIQRPVRSFFLITSLTPTALGGWVAMLAAMPFANDVYRLGFFTAGVLIASYLWHPALSIAGASLGGRLTERGQRTLSRCGGASMGVLGLGLAGSQLL